MKINPLSFMMSQLKPFYWHIFGFVVIAVFWAVNLSFQPYLIKVIIDRMTHTTPSQVWSHAAWLVCLYVAASVVMNIVYRIWNLIRRNFIPALKGNITKAMMAYLLQHSYRYYQSSFAGSLANKINDVAYGVAMIVEIIINQFFGTFLALIVATMTLCTVSPILALFFILWVISFLMGSFYFARQAHRLSDHASELRSQLTGKIVDILSNMAAVRLFSRPRFEQRNIDFWTDEAVEAERKFDWLLLKLFGYQSSSFVVMQALALFYLVYERSQNAITVGDFALVFTINVYVVEAIWNLGQQFITFSEQLGKITQGLKITMTNYEMLDPPQPKSLMVNRGEIVFDDIVFYYHQQAPLFNHLSVKILPGQKVGLVGYSGSGKTTFANLILRLFDVNAGSILIDGQDIREVSQASLREEISLIPQDPSLFHRTLSENIAYADPAASSEAIINAAKAGHAHEFIMQLPDQYNTLVGERGVKLSGGQRQRIAISRAILKNAPILILDEATSALDSVTEKLIQESLHTLMQGKTTIVIAHRLSTLLEMDRILVFDRGNIIEDGSHEALLQQQGLYARLWHSQAGGFLPN